jgi:hypothetical protein
MGYSARYHAASLAAVFLALAIGILIGVGFGDDVVSGTREDLESSLTDDLEAARERADELAVELGQSEEFGDQVFPVLVGSSLRGRRIGVLALGGLPDDTSRSIESALEPTGARLRAVAVVREPPDLKALADELEETRLSRLDDEPDEVEAFGKAVGRQFILGGDLLDTVRGKLLSRASGAFGNLDAVIVVRQQPEDLNANERGDTGRLESGLLDGLTATGAAVVGVETTDDDPSSMGFLAPRISTVDHLDQVAGKVSMVFALLGTDGDYGVKDTADRLLPDVLTPPPSGPTQP